MIKIRVKRINKKRINNNKKIKNIKKRKERPVDIEKAIIKIKKKENHINQNQGKERIIHQAVRKAAAEVAVEIEKKNIL